MSALLGRRVTGLVSRTGSGSLLVFQGYMVTGYRVIGCQGMSFRLRVTVWVLGLIGVVG